MTTETTLVDAPLFPRLIVKARGRVVQEVEVRGEITIGRAEENELQLTDPKASRHHARIRREGRYFVLEDLDSANGTRVDGVLITQTHILEHGQRITIGDTEIGYQEPGQAFQDTVTMEGVPPGVPAGAVPGMMPDRSGMLSDEGRGSGLSKGLIAGLILAGVILVVAVILALIFLPGGDGDTTPTAQPVAGATETGAAPAETPTGEAPQATDVPADTPQTPSSGADPAEVNDLLTQAEALSRRSKFEEAIAIYETLVEQVPNDPRPETGWAWALILDAEGEEALAHAQRAVEL
ncbi:MAG: FHA domain-containing protein, partial [Anaerolineae bacterium]